MLNSLDTKTEKYIRDQFSCLRADISFKEPFLLNEFEQEKINYLARDGFTIVEDFLKKQFCEKIILELDEAFIRFKEKVLLDNLESDQRLFGVEAVSDSILDFHQSHSIQKLLMNYERTEIFSTTTMAGRLHFVPNNLGSGGGWHRDSTSRVETKAILYLTDVAIDNGPFQYIIGSHLPEDIIANHLSLGFPIDKNRYNSQEVSKVLENQPTRLKTFEAKAGTLILADTRGIHRGMPINRGCRYSLTKYNWAQSSLPDKIKKLMI